MDNLPILQMEGVRKTFGSVVALNNVNLTIQENEIHGLLGGNGAGKTTLVNVLYGLYRPDAGKINLSGKPVTINSPKDAIKHGIGMVHQHFLQVDSFSVVENIVLGTSLKNRPTLNLNPAIAEIKRLSKQFGLNVDPKSIIEDLPMGIRQRVEILKALYRKAKILILDEPTTNLTPQEVDFLFQSLQEMVKAGMSVVFITHKLREVLSVCNRITVLRGGESVVTLARKKSSEEAFIKAMVGEKLDVEKSLIFSQDQLAIPQPINTQKPILNVNSLVVKDENNQTLIDNCSFSIQPQEIFGIAGVAGNGQHALAESIIGLQAIKQGQITIANTLVNKTKTVKLLEQLVSYIPEDRLLDGYLPTATVAQNLILGFHHRTPYSKKGFLNWQTIYKAASRLITEYNIMTSGPEATAANLSGGNIQRVMIARAFSYQAKLLIAHNPTRGLDIPSMEFIYTKLLNRKKQATATLLISEDLDELLLLCDRIATIYRGKIVGILNKNQFDKYQIGRMMSGIPIENTL